MDIPLTKIEIHYHKSYDSLSEIYGKIQIPFPITSTLQHLITIIYDQIEENIANFDS